MTGDPFGMDRLFDTGPDESHDIEPLGEVLARLQAVLDAKRRRQHLDRQALRAAAAVPHSRLEPNE